MRTWTATTTTAAHPDAVLDVLCDPEPAARWATGALLSAGALNQAVSRIGREAALCC